jgi:Flp pilus assembly protein TadB
MTDPYRISEASDDARPASHAGAQRGLLRPVLWVVLIVSAAANAVTSSAGLNPFVGAGFGVITLASVTALIVHHYRHRRD